MQKRKLIGRALIFIGVIIFFSKPILNFTGFAVIEKTFPFLIKNIWSYLSGLVLIIAGLFMVGTLAHEVNSPVKRKTDFEYSKHVSRRHVKRRGWSRELIRQTIADADKLALSRQKLPPHRLAIVYYMKEEPNQYVVRDTEGNLLQVSNLRDPNWKPHHWRSDFLYLGKYSEQKRRETHKHKVYKHKKSK